LAEPSWRELNQAMWNERIPLHLRSRLYDLPKFKAGALSLRSHEIADLGDVRGKELIHLQCHFGKDTLSWARLGAHVTGLDFSEAAVRAAVALRELDGDVLHQWPMMIRGEDRLYRMPPGTPSLPLMYVLRAIRDG
jgi:2-polyprenyl-3-methyl-5-hydroxy-6-metoxy-1,4-benzoquinol methylase